jgi:hypothetical protein
MSSQPPAVPGLPPAPAPGPASTFIARRLGARRVSEPYAHASLSDEQRSQLMSYGGAGAAGSSSPPSALTLANRSLSSGRLVPQKSPRQGTSVCMIPECVLRLPSRTATFLHAALVVSSPGSLSAIIPTHPLTCRAGPIHLIRTPAFACVFLCCVLRLLPSPTAGTHCTPTRPRTRTSVCCCAYFTKPAHEYRLAHVDLIVVYFQCIVLFFSIFFARQPRRISVRRAIISTTRKMSCKS